MADLKTPFTDPAMPAPGLEGDSITHRGGDPLTDTGGASGLQPIWAEGNFGFGPTETPNSVSGLPGLPNRWEPSESSAQPPDLTDRNPGTIDKR